jgi:hypothetical protein
MALRPNHRRRSNPAGRLPWALHTPVQRSNSCETGPIARPRFFGDTRCIARCPRRRRAERCILPRSEDFLTRQPGLFEMCSCWHLEITFIFLHFFLDKYASCVYINGQEREKTTNIKEQKMKKADYIANETTTMAQAIDKVIQDDFDDDCLADDYSALDDYVDENAANLIELIESGEIETVPGYAEWEKEAQPRIDAEFSRKMKNRAEMARSLNISS